MTSQNGKKSKRLDLQGIRGLSIVFLVLFHFFPDTFPNGYLGVDQFFVLSGFIMCMLLERSKKKPAMSLIFNFYSKRLLRILPLYLLIILITMSGIIWFLPTSIFNTNKTSAQRALSFLSNQPGVGDEDFFEKLSMATDFLVHLWSLSVEVHYYVLIPLLFLDVNKFESPKIRLSIYGSIGVLSFLFHVFCSPTTAFSSVFARIWQFLIGMIAFLVSTEIKNGYQLLPEMCFDFNVLEPYKNLVLGVLIYVATYSIPLPSLISRLAFTVLTGILILISVNDKFLSNPILAYIGEISYTLFLVHWPIFAYWKFEMEYSLIAQIMSLLVSFLMTIIIHETFEKWSMKLSTWKTSLLIAFLFMANLTAIYKEEILYNSSWNLDQYDEKVILENPEEMNRIWSQNDEKQLNIPEIEGWGGWNYRRDFPLDGTAKFLIFGSSTAANMAKTIQEECQHKAKSLLQGTYATCEPLFPTSSGPKCSSILDEFQEHVEKEQPEYAFMAGRHFDLGRPFPKGIDKLEHDPIFIFAREQLRMYAKNVQQKLFVLMPLPRINPKKIRKIAKMVKDNRLPEEIDKQIVDFEGYEMARRRFEKLMEDCGEKCVPVDFTQEFTDEKSKNFRYFNFLGFSYFTTGNHLTPFGIVRVRHIFRELCRNL